MAACAIRTEGLTRDFGSITAVSDLTLEVEAGTVFGFIGQSGAGKTTTIRLLLGLLEPTSGRAEVLGYDIRSEADKVRGCTGVLLEHSGLCERLSAWDNLQFYARVWKLPVADRWDRIRELLDRLELWERRDETVAEWSRGMRQKLAVARALLHRPPLVFLDEPTSGLDPVAAAALRDDLAELAQNDGTTVFLTTHNLAEAEKICDRIGVIANGELKAIGTPHELREQLGSPRVRVVGRGFSEQVLAILRARPEVRSVARENGHLIMEPQRQGSVAPLVSILVGSGVQVEEVHPMRSTLEDVFFSLLGEEPVT